MSFLILEKTLYIDSFFKKKKKNSRDYSETPQCGPLEMVHSLFMMFYSFIRLFEFDP